MTDRVLRLAVGCLAAAGVAIAAYLTYARYAGTTITCTTGGCETVQSSSYATVAGVPVAVLGLCAYAAMFVTALSGSELARAAGATIALASFAFSAYLLYVQLALIGEVCDWCVLNDAVATALLPFAVLRTRVPVAALA